MNVLYILSRVGLPHPRGAGLPSLRSADSGWEYKDWGKREIEPQCICRDRLWKKYYGNGIVALSRSSIVIAIRKSVTHRMFFLWDGGAMPEKQRESAKTDKGEVRYVVRNTGDDWK